MTSYWRGEYRDETDGRYYSRIKCFKCQGVGHAARNCTSLTSKQRLYDIDRIETGIKFKFYKFTDVKVTCPGLICSLCKAEILALEKAKMQGSHAWDDEGTNCGCTKPIPETGPIDEFKNLQLGRQFEKNIVDKECCNFEAPTPIQRYALPIINDGYDVMGCAQTGTGKTAAYIIPMVKFIKDNKYGKKPVGRRTPQRPEVLILAPTRELATQIAKTTRKLTNDIKPECGVCLVFGGNRDRQKQQAEIRRGCNILIGTTGRVLQLINNFTITLDNIKFFVLDEADKMLDMGFGPDIDTIIDERKTFMTSKNLRQSLLFSATFRNDLREVAKKSLKDDHRLIEAGEIGSAQPNVEQTFLLVEDLDDDGERFRRSFVQELKRSQLNELLLRLMLKGEESFRDHRCWEKEPYDGRNHPNVKDFMLHVLGGCSKMKILIFVNTKIAAREISYSISDYLNDQLKERFNNRFEDLVKPDQDDDFIENFGVIFMSGELTQYEREENVNLFKDGVYPIMVSTNVLARGIDIEGVTHVINFDLPQDLRNLPKFREHDDQISRTNKPERNQFEEYIHRIGRTGRAGNTGKSITFFERENDKNLAIPLVRMLGEAKQVVPRWLEGIAKSESGYDFCKTGAAHEQYKLVGDQREKQKQVEGTILKNLLKGDEKFWNPNHKCWLGNRSGNLNTGPTLGDYLHHMLGKCCGMKMVIFVSTGDAAIKVAEDILVYIRAKLREAFFNSKNNTIRLDGDRCVSTDDFKIICVHEGLDEDARKENFKDFREVPLYPFLVCTHKVTRGVNINDITHIINYDLPQSFGILPRFEEPARKGLKGKKIKQQSQNRKFKTVYRIYSTNSENAQNSGKMIAFFQRNRDEHLAIPLEEMLYKEKQRVPKWLADIAEKQRDGRRGRPGGKGPERADQLQWNKNDGLCPDEIWGSHSNNSEE